MFKLDLEKQRNQRSNCQHPLDHRKSKRVPEKTYFCFTDYTKAFDYVDHNKLWKILQEMGIPDHLTCLPRSLYAGQETTVSARFGSTYTKIGTIQRRTWKQPRCPSADKWIRKLWYIYKMEYYSAIKKNTFESVLMIWMKLEPIYYTEWSKPER